MMTTDTSRPVVPALNMPDETALPDDPMPPIFDVAEQDLPWSQADVLSVDDDGNVLPGADEIDDDPNDNGDIVLKDIAENVPDLPVDADIDPSTEPRPPGAG